MGTPLEQQFARFLTLLESGKVVVTVDPAAFTLQMHTVQQRQELLLQEHEKRLLKVEAESEKTRIASQADLQTEIDRYRASQQHWVRWIIGVLVAALVSGLLLVLGKAAGAK